MSVAVSVSEPTRTSSSTGPSRSASCSMSVAIYMHDLSGGGVERQNLIIAEELRLQGVKVTLVLHRVRGPLLDQIPEELPVVDLNSRRTLGDIPRLARYLRSEKPDILLANLDLNNIAALLAKALAFSPTKVVICQHNPLSGSWVDSENGLYRFVSTTYRVLSPLISQAVAVSSGVAGELTSLSGLPTGRVTTINNPVIGSDFDERCNSVTNHPWFDKPDQPVFVTAGRLVAAKDHETMLRALAIHRNRYDSRLMILGSGPLRQSLGQLAREIGVGDAVDFLGYQTNVLPFLRRADAFVLSSRCEGFGNVLVEAMGCGTPVISTRCAYGPAEILDDGRYGLLVKESDAGALAAAMDQVSSLRIRFPPDLLRRRAADFSYAECAARYMAMFKTLAPHRAWAA